MESELLLARVSDVLEQSVISNKRKFLGFLSLEESVLVKNFLEKRNAHFCLYGGYQDSQRKMLCCYPEWLENPNFPITALSFKYRNDAELKHRDFLGSLMALGIKRETVGDILIENGRAVAFLKNEVVDFVTQNIQKVGNTGVVIEKGFTSPLPVADVLVESSVTVASCRLDCVVSALGSCSRNTACELIESGMVAVNSEIVQKTTKIINDGDVLSIRHKGKFEIISTLKRTKKDRLVLCFKRY
jgi:RNA-binding protein YlmH